MDLFPTQNVDETYPTPVETEQDRPWGRLLPLKKKWPSLDLLSESYTFGRADDCDFVFQLDMFDDLNQFSTLSKKHFKIFSEFGKHGKLVFIEDLSSNGTFVNGVKIGRGKILPLNNNDEVSLSFSYLKCFIFSDSSCVQDEYPSSVTSKFTVSKLLGRGACGEVRLVFDKGTCKKRAMKIVQKKTFSATSKFDKDISTRIQSEVNILMKLKHPGTIRIFDVIDTTEAIYMILELVEGGELFDRIVNLGKIPEQDSKFLFYQVAVAVKYLHENGITHRDLKPENILLMSNENRCLIKVTDFGLSKFVDGNTMLRTFCGTPTYLAPEVLLTAGSGTYTSSIDVWSLGVILYICLAGYPPFTDERKDYDLQTQITRGLYEFHNQYWTGVTSSAMCLIKRMLTVDPSKRPSIQAVLEDPWFQDAEINQELRVLYASLTADESPYPLSFTEQQQMADAPQPVINETLPDCPVTQMGLPLCMEKDRDNHTILQDEPLIRKRPATNENFIPQKQFIY